MILFQSDRTLCAGSQKWPGTKHGGMLMLCLGSLGRHLTFEMPSFVPFCPLPLANLKLAQEVKDVEIAVCLSFFEHDC